jgi:hypothetical protein
MEKKLTNSGSFMKSTSKHNIYSAAEVCPFEHNRWLVAVKA